MNTVIEVSNLSKLYEIGERGGYKTLRDIFSNSVKATARKLLSLGQGQKSESSKTEPSSNLLWALDNVSFDVEQGQAIGIIGSNGAGKSTLLKILSRITEPTQGTAKIKGRLGSLLEVGTGFHPELTGRENIFLSGIILGMKRQEIKKRFDEIVAFAEVEKFIDTPVRHYSSGMYVRLAFSVAAHLTVDILAIDEVLAVGDAAFQKRCLGKMDETISSEGRTILFVSHNIGAIKHLTDKCLLLDHGKLIKYGETEEIINTYLQQSMSLETSGFVDLTSMESRRGTKKNPLLNITFQSLTLQKDNAQISHIFFEQEAINIELAFQSKIKANFLEIIVVILTFEGTIIFSAFTASQAGGVDIGAYKTKCRFDPNILRPGTYRVRLYLKSAHWQDVIPEAATFKVESNPVEDHELTYTSTHPGMVGLVRADYEWEPLQTLK